MIIKKFICPELGENPKSPTNKKSMKTMMINKKLHILRRDNVSKSSDKIKKELSIWNLNVSSKDNVFSENDLEICVRKSLKQNVITILNKKQNERTKREKAIIAEIIEKSDVFRRFENSTNDKELLDNFVKLTSAHMNYQSLEEKEILFYEGDIGDKFFIILQGSVKIVQYRPKEAYFNFEEYLDFLNDLKSTGDMNLINKIINENKGIFSLEIRKIDDLITFKETIKLRKSIELSQDHTELANILEAYKSNKNFNFFIHSKNDLIRGNNYFKFLKNSSLKEATKDYEISKLDKRHHIKIYYIHELTILDKGCYFGDHALDKVDLIRTATVIGNEKTHLGYIDYKVYVEFILKNKQKIELKECEYMLNKYFHFILDKHEFHDKYFKFFFFKEKSKGETLFNDEDYMNYIYLIKEGEIEYTYNNSLNNLINMIKEISGKTGLKYSPCSYEEDISFKQKIFKSMNIIKNYKILITNNENYYGLDHYFFGIPKNFQLKVISKSVKYYSFSIDKLEEMLLKNPKLRTFLEKGTLNRIITLNDRLNEIKKSSLELLRKEFKEKHFEVEKVEARPKKYQTSVLPQVFNLNSFYGSNSNDLKQFPKRDSKILINHDPNFKDEIFSLSINLSKNSPNVKDTINNQIKINASPRRSLKEERKNEVFQNYFPLNSKNEMKFNIIINEKLLSDNKYKKTYSRNNIDIKQDSIEVKHFYNSNIDENHLPVKSNILNNPNKISFNDSLTKNINLHQQFNLDKSHEKLTLPLVMKSHDNIYFSLYNSNQDKLKKDL